MAATSPVAPTAPAAASRLRLATDEDGGFGAGGADGSADMVTPRHRRRLGGDPHLP
ncbi:hypothetical protein STRAU_7164 [Streptomyces aurantiacus JA 4570]|uniref:Uncharacterized protein n=1 Tax=Streptomyces aurantiacus JA 4570 TaxID=1286094 RepID=S3ZAY0_9ACTN|nr:hypothetical protein STRAU_7164 [Streptomyces aurantiacus JA 4570]